MNYRRPLRETQRPDTFYRNVETDAVFLSPDGIGRFWYDSLEEAEEEHGDDLPVVEVKAEEWDD